LVPRSARPKYLRMFFLKVGVKKKGGKPKTEGSFKPAGR